MEWPTGRSVYTFCIAMESKIGRGKGKACQVIFGAFAIVQKESDGDILAAFGARRSARR